VEGQKFEESRKTEQRAKHAGAGKALSLLVQ